MDLTTKLETTTKNQQASIQSLEAEFDRLADKQSGRPSGSLPSKSQQNLKVVCMVVSSQNGKAIPSHHECPNVMEKFKPCQEFLKATGVGGNFPPTCCGALQDLSNTRTFDHKTTCYCLKEAVRNDKDIVPKRALRLPQWCNVTLPYTISIDTDCTKVK
ncbi:reverse transcriptase domain-containing protein [Tanacetum coccineum]